MNTDIWCNSSLGIHMRTLYAMRGKGKYGASKIFVTPTFTKINLNRVDKNDRNYSLRMLGRTNMRALKMHVPYYGIGGDVRF